MQHDAFSMQEKDMGNGKYISFSKGPKEKVISKKNDVTLHSSAAVLFSQILHRTSCKNVKSYIFVVCITMVIIIVC